MFTSNYYELCVFQLLLIMCVNGKEMNMWNVMHIQWMICCWGSTWLWYDWEMSIIVHDDCRQLGTSKYKENCAKILTEISASLR